MVAGPPSAPASFAAFWLQGRLRASNAQAKRSSRQSFSRATTSGAKLSYRAVIAACAMRRASEVPISPADLGAGPLLHASAHRSEIGLRPEERVGDGQHLAHRAADDHRHAKRFRLVEAEPHILVGKPGGEAEVEGPRQDGFRELVLGRAAAAAADVEDVDHGPGIE